MDNQEETMKVEKIGLKDSKGKPMVELVPPQAILELATPRQI